MSPHPIEVQLPSDERAPGLARRALREIIGEHDRTEDLLVCVSEVVTNALTHGGGLVRLTVTLEGEELLVAVVDAAPFSVPERHEPGNDQPSGRGVRLLERFADDWGVETDGSRKIVWFAAHLSDGAGPQGSRIPRGGTPAQMPHEMPLPPEGPTPGSAG